MATLDALKKKIDELKNRINQLNDSKSEEKVQLQEQILIIEECEKIIDDYTAKCPYCGHPISSDDSISDDRLRNLADIQKSEENAESQTYANYGKLQYTFFRIDVIIVIVMVIILLFVLLLAFR